MTQTVNETVHRAASGWTPVQVSDTLSAISIAYMLPTVNDAVVWRGDKKSSLVLQLLRDVEWGDLDYLVIDTPPGI